MATVVNKFMKQRNKWADATPVVPDATYLEIQYLKQEERYEDVLILAKEIELLNKNSAYTYLTLAIAYSDCDLYEESIAAYDKCLHLFDTTTNPDNNLMSKFQMTYHKGEACRLAGKNELAIEVLTDSIQLMKTSRVWLGDRDPYFERALAYSELEEDELALADMQESIKLHPNQAESYCVLGDILDQLERFEEAIYSYDISLVLDPQSSTTHNNKGCTLNNMNLFREAIQLFEEAIRLDPNSHAPFCHMAFAKAALGFYDEALELYDKALEIYPNYQNAQQRKEDLLRDLEMDK